MLTDKDPGVIWAQKAVKEVENMDGGQHKAMCHEVVSADQNPLQVAGVGLLYQHPKRRYTDAIEGRQPETDRAQARRFLTWSAGCGGRTNHALYIDSQPNTGPASNGAEMVGTNISIAKGNVAGPVTGWEGGSDYAGMVSILSDEVVYMAPGITAMPSPGTERPIAGG